MAWVESPKPYLIGEWLESVDISVCVCMCIVCIYIYICMDQAMYYMLRWVFVFVHLCEYIMKVWRCDHGACMNSLVQRMWLFSWAIRCTVSSNTGKQEFILIHYTYIYASNKEFYQKKKKNRTTTTTTKFKFKSTIKCITFLLSSCFFH